jgi:excisionase family DNA binding protein
MTNEAVIVEKLTAIEQLLNKQGLLQKEALSFADACDYLHVSASYLYKLTGTNQVPHYIPTGKKIYFKRSELDEWLFKNKRSSVTEIEKAAADYIIGRPV